MAQISIIIIAGLIFLFSYSQGESGNEIDQVLAISTTLAFTLAPAILAYLLGIIATRRLPDKYEIKVKRLYFVEKLFFGFEILVLITFVVDLYYLKLPSLIDQWLSFFDLVALRRLITMIPLVAGILLIRLAAHELERRVYSTTRGRKEYLFTQLKFMMFPLFPLLIYLSFLDIAERLPIQFRIFFIDHSYISIFILGILIVITYIAAPKLLQFLWKSKPLEDCEFKSRIKVFANRHNIKYKEIAVWQTGRAQIANAGVTGLLPWFRKIFVTDLLLERFTTEEIETIIAHEFGHIKYKHLLVYLAFSLAYFTCYSFFYVYVVPLWEKFFGNSSTSEAIVAIIFFIMYFVLIFRYLSRKFERQADLYAVSATGAPETFKRALAKLSYLNYVPPKIRKWLELFHTHPSISRRLEFVDSIVAGDKSALKYSRTLLETKITLFLLPFLFLLLFLNFDKIIPPAEMHYEKGRQYFREEMIDDAVDEFNSAIVADANFADAHYILSLIYDKQEKWHKAKEHLLEVLRIDKDNQDAKEALIEVYYENGRQYIREKKIDEAMNEFKSAVAADPDFADAHYLLAQIYGEKEEWHKAREHLLEVLRIDKDNQKAKRLLAEVYYEEGRRYLREEMIDDAVDEFNKASAADANFADAHYVLGLIYGKQKKWRKAKEHLLEVLKIDKDNKDAKDVLEQIEDFVEDEK